VFVASVKHGAAGGRGGGGEGGAAGGKQQQQQQQQQPAGGKQQKQGRSGPAPALAPQPTDGAAPQRPVRTGGGRKAAARAAAGVAARVQDEDAFVDFEAELMYEEVVGGA